MKKIYAIVEDEYGNILLKREVRARNSGFFYPVPMEGKYLCYWYEDQHTGEIARTLKEYIVVESSVREDWTYEIFFPDGSSSLVDDLSYCRKVSDIKANFVNLFQEKLNQVIDKLTSEFQKIELHDFYLPNDKFECEAKLEEFAIIGKVKGLFEIHVRRYDVEYDD